MKKKLIIAIIAIVLAVAIPVTAFVVLGNKEKPEKVNHAAQYAAMESAALHEIVNVLLAEGSGSESNDIPKLASSVTVDVIPSDALLSMVGAQELDWVDKLTMSMDVLLDGTALETALGIGMNGKTIANLDMIMDPMAGISYMAIPAISNYYLKVQNASAAAMPVEMAELRELLSALPTMRESVNKYIDLALAEMKNVEKGTEQITVAGKTETVTVYTNYITEAVAADIVKSVLNAAKNDSALKALLPADADLEAAIDSFLDTIPENPANDKEDALVLKVYLDAGSEVIGRSFDIADDMQIFYLSTSDGTSTKLGFVEAAKGLTLEITDGSIILYTTENSKTSELASFIYSGDEKQGTATLKITAADTGTQMAVVLNWNTTGNKTVVTLALQAGTDSVTLATLTCTGDENEGSVELKLADAIEAMIFGSAEIDPSLLISWGDQTAKMDVLLMGEKLVTFEITETEKTPTDINIPSNVLDMTDPNAMQTFVDSIQLDTLQQNMLNAGIPANIAALLISALQNSFA